MVPLKPDISLAWNKGTHWQFYLIYNTNVFSDWAKNVDWCLLWFRHIHIHAALWSKTCSEHFQNYNLTFVRDAIIIVHSYHRRSIGSDIGPGSKVWQFCWSINYSFLRKTFKFIPISYGDRVDRDTNIN